VNRATCEDGIRRGCFAVQSHISWPTFQRCLLLPSVIYETRRRSIAEGFHLNTRRHWKLRAHGNVPSGSIKWEEFNDKLTDSQVRKERFVAWRLLVGFGVPIRVFLTLR
jgi:hypothetical protein